MIVVRDIFRLKFGQAKQATALWTQAAVMLRQSGYGRGDTRLLTDLAGPPYYTLILESTFDSVAQWEEAHHAAPSNAEWRAVYDQITQLTETGHREILKVVT